MIYVHFVYHKTKRKNEEMTHIEVYDVNFVKRKKFQKFYLLSVVVPFIHDIMILSDTNANVRGDKHTKRRAEEENLKQVYLIVLMNDIQFITICCSVDTHAYTNDSQSIVFLPINMR